MIAEGVSSHSKETGLVIYLAFLAKVARFSYTIMTAFNKYWPNIAAKFNRLKGTLWYEVLYLTLLPNGEQENSLAWAVFWCNSYDKKSIFDRKISSASVFEFSCAVVVDAGAARSMMRGLQPDDYRSHKIDKNQLYFFSLSSFQSCWLY